MNRKIVYLPLICLVALSIIYGCSTTALFSHAPQSTDDILCEFISATESACQSAEMYYPLGDPIDDPKPHSH